MYTIKQASIRTGVSIALLRAWERRYGIPTPVRTPSGYRLYDDGSIAQVRSMRQLVDEGWAPRQAAVEVVAGRGPRPEPAGGVNTVAPSAGGTPSLAPSSTLVERIAAAAATLDEAAIEAALGEAMLALDFESVVENVWLPALVAVGDGWAAGKIDVASEHALSAAVLRRLGIAYEAAGRAGSHPDVLVGLPPGSRHELGALAFAVVARRAGIGVLYLGADVPVESWTRAVWSTGARAVVLGVVTPADRDAARDVLVALSGMQGPPSLFVGGPGAGGDNLPGSVLPSDLAAGVESVRRALRSPS